MQVIGWSMWFSEYLFLERTGPRMKVGLQRLKNYPQPFWLALFAEGTRFTQAKLLTAQEYASLNGLPVPEMCSFREQSVHMVHIDLTCEALERVFKATLELLVAYKDQVAGIVYVFMPSYSGVFICLEAANEEPKDDDGMDDSLETDDGEDDGSDNDMGDDAGDGDEADSLRLQRLAAQAKSFRPADDDDDDSVMMRNYI
ncbi:hypothetical protein Tco_0625047 [Tanacetum coccineum]|uniref:Uncharacterized protein n=1 Tax=Tanacetum coccineum TaxID=301880 RepID=A0ABQ4WFU0_9ASTR